MKTAIRILAAEQKARRLAALNRSLARAHEKPVTIPPADRLDMEAPDSGEDLP